MMMMCVCVLRFMNFRALFARRSTFMQNNKRSKKQQQRKLNMFTMISARLLLLLLLRCRISIGISEPARTHWASAIMGTVIPIYEFASPRAIRPKRIRIMPPIVALSFDVIFFPSSLWPIIHTSHFRSITVCQVRVECLHFSTSIIRMGWMDIT